MKVKEMKMDGAQVVNKKEKTARLTWWILEQKLMYYYPEYGNCVEDHVYDENEDLYKKLCSELKVSPTACENVGFPFESPSGKLVVSKLEKKKRTLTKLG